MHIASLTRVSSVLLVAFAASACVPLNGQPQQKSPMELQMEAMANRLAELERRALGSSQVDMFTDLQSLQARARELSGELERVRFELDQLRSQQKNFYVDLDGRLQVLESGSAGASSNTAVSDNAQTAYEQALELLKKGRYDQANVALQQFLQQHPQHELSGNAQYWLGESFYVAQSFDKAAKAFETVMQQYPDSKKVRDAMLKLGYTRAAQGQKTEAKALLERVVRDYAGTTQANLAQKKLATL